MARALGVTELYSKKFEILTFTGDYEKSYGNPEKNFSAIFYGKSGNGKTEGVIMFCKYLCQFGNVYYNSYEQGHSESLVSALRRQKMEDVRGRFLVGHKEPYQEMIKRLKKKKSPQTVVIDSIQYIRMTYDMWLELRNMFPRKRFILISHANGDEPDGYHAKKIEFDVDIKVLVKGYVAHPKCRFGGNHDFMIWEEGHRRYINRVRNKGKLPEAPKETAPELPLTEPNESTEILKAV